MGKSDKSTLDKIKDDVRVLQKLDMNQIVGGKDKSKTTKWNSGCKGIVPQ